MAGYIQVVSRVARPNDKGGSNVLAVKTFMRKARETFDAKVKVAKSAGCKFGEVEEFELVPFEISGKERQLVSRVVGTDKEGEPVTIILERFHVGGQLEARRAENGE